MKIEVDLTRVHDSPDLGRVAAVALLSAMPLDEARLAIEEWEAVLDAREVWDRDGAAEDIPLPAAALQQESFRIRTTEGGEQVLDSPKPLPSDWKLQPEQKTENGAGTRLEDCLGAKTAGALKRAGFQVLGDLECRSGEWLLHTVDRFGKGGLAEVEAAMAAAGLALSGKPGVPQRKALPGTPSDREISQSIEAGSTPATPPFLKPADEISQSEERAGPGTPAVKQSDFLSEQPGDVIATPNGQDIVVPEKESLRALCRRAEGEIGRERTWAILQACGVDKISSASPEQDAAVRAAVKEALHA